MAHLHRLIFCAFLALFTSSSFASFPPILDPNSCIGETCYNWQALTNSGSFLAAYPTFAAACAFEVSYHGAGGSCALSADGQDFNLVLPSGQTYYGAGHRVVVPPLYTCPVNSLLAGSQCACNAGFFEVGSTCLTKTEPLPSGPTDDQKKCASLAGKSAGSMSAPYSPLEGISGGKYTNLCDPGTASNPLNCALSVYYDLGVDGIKYGEGKYGGGTCKPGTGDGSTPSDTPTSKGALPAGAEPNLCGKGSVPGLVNGIKICSPASDRNVIMSGPSSSSSPAGTASSPVSGIPNAPPTAATSSSSVTCTNGSCTTTTTFKDVSGSAVGSASTTVSQAGFCKENPSAPVCADGADSSFAGVCGEPPKCEGDAVMCAVALADFSTNCKLLEVFKPDEDLERSAKAALDGSDGINTDKMKADAHSSAVSISNFDTGGKGWSRSCPADPVIPIPFGTVHEWTMPLSRLCGPLGVLANAAVGITLLGALIWVIGGGKT